MKNGGEIKRLSSFLKGHNYRLTSQRLEVLQLVLETNGHFDIEGIVDTVRQRRLKVSRATVYRTLEYLEQGNVIQRVHTAHGKRLFERVPGKKRHEHIYCLKCGRTVEFRDPTLEERVHAISEMNGFTCANYAFQISGVCDNCRRSATPRRGLVSS